MTAVLFAFIIVMGFLLSTNALARPITLSYSSGYGDTFSLSLHDRWWAEEVAKRTNGRVRIEFYWSEGLAKIPESLDAVKTGLVDISFFATGMFGAQLPLLTASQLFYLTEQPHAVSKAMMEMYRTFPAMKEELERKNNVRPLSFSGCTPLIFGARQPWKTFEEFRGKKIRSFPGLEEPLAKIGAVPVAISWGEIYVSLERGVIDAYTGTMWDLAAIGRFQEQAPYILDLGVGTYAMAGTFINLDTWNRLPADIQKIIEEVAAEAIAKQPELYMQADKRAYEIYKKDNVKTIIISDTEKEKFRNIVVPDQWNKWIQDMESKGLPGREFFDKYQSAIKKYQKDGTYISPFVRFEDLRME